MNVCFQCDVWLIDSKQSKTTSILDQMLSSHNCRVYRRTVDDDCLTEFQMETTSHELSFFVLIEIASNVEKQLITKIRKRDSNARIICCHISPKYILCDFGTAYNHSLQQTVESVAAFELKRDIESDCIRDIIEISCDTFLIIVNNAREPLLPVKQLRFYEQSNSLFSSEQKAKTCVVVFGCEKLGFTIATLLRDIGVDDLFLVSEDVVHKYDVDDEVFHADDCNSKKCLVLCRNLLTTKCKRTCNIHQLFLNPKQFQQRMWSDFKENGAVIVLTVHDNLYKRYVHKMCLYNELPIIDVGVEQSKYHIHVSVPFQTDTYFAINDPPETIEYPLCVIKSFPSQIEHCVIWALQKFENWFRKKLKSASSWRECIASSRLTFEKHYNEKPRQLLLNIPLERKNESGVLFWSEHKQPNPLTFSSNHELCFTFLTTFATITAELNNVTVERKDLEYVNEILSETNVPHFVPKQKRETQSDEKVAIIDTVKSTFSSDRDEHLWFVHSAANLRAELYNIPSIGFDDLRRMIINSVPCSTAAVNFAALNATNEVEKVLTMKGEYNKQMSNSKHHFVNLLDSKFNVVCDPLPAQRRTLGSLSFCEWTSWTIFEQKKENTLQDLLCQLEQMSGGLSCTMIVMEYKDVSKTLFINFLPDCNNRKQKPLRELMELTDSCDLKFVVLIVCFDSQNEDVLGPLVKYHFLSAVV